MCQECRYCYHPAMFDPTKALCIYTGAYAPCTRVCVYIYIYIHVCVCGRTRLCLVRVCVCMYMYVCVCARVVSSFIRSLRDAQVFHDVGYWCSCTCSYLGSSHILTLSLVERKKKKKKILWKERNRLEISISGDHKSRATILEEMDDKNLDDSYRR